MSDFGKILIFVGVLLLLAGLVFVLLGRTGLPVGRLPGDFVWRGRNSVVYFPLATCIILSIVLSLLFYLFGRSHR